MCLLMFLLLLLFFGTFIHQSNIPKCRIVSISVAFKKKKNYHHIKSKFVSCHIKKKRFNTNIFCAGKWFLCFDVIFLVSHGIGFHLPTTSFERFNMPQLSMHNYIEYGRFKFCVSLMVSLIDTIWNDEKKNNRYFVCSWSMPQFNWNKLLYQLPGNVVCHVWFLLV